MTCTGRACPEQSNRIDIVFDTQRELSTKNEKRSIQGENQGNRVQKISAQQIITRQAVEAFLRQLMNKTSLIKFLSSEWRKPLEKMQKNPGYIRKYQIQLVLCQNGESESHQLASFQDCLNS